MRASDEMLSYRIPPEHRGYYELSSAIVATAVKDYRRMKKLGKELGTLRSFFLSEVFENISGVENPNLFLMRLDEQIEKEMKDGIQRKREKQAMKCNG